MRRRFAIAVCRDVIQIALGSDLAHIVRPESGSRIRSLVKPERAPFGAARRRPRGQAQRSTVDVAARAVVIVTSSSLVRFLRCA